MTDPSNLDRLVRDPSTGEMVWQRPSTDDLDLASLPDRLDDEMLARVEAISRSPLPALPPCDSRLFAQSLRMMLAVLPRRQADDLSGELFVAAYERQLGHYADDAITYLCDHSIRTCKWFPTVSECLELLTGWRRGDVAVHRQWEAQKLASRERNLRRNEEMAARQLPPPPPITQEAVAAMDDKLIKLGLSCGALVQDADGNVGPAPEAA
jgi:hypothetical protein